MRHPSSLEIVAIDNRGRAIRPDYCDIFTSLLANPLATSQLSSNAQRSAETVYFAANRTTQSNDAIERNMQLDALDTENRNHPVIRAD